MVLIYDGWGWDKSATSSRRMSGRTTCGCPEKGEVGGHGQEAPCAASSSSITSILDKLSKAKRLTIDFEDDDDDSIEMQVPRFGEALGALKFCEENKK